MTGCYTGDCRCEVLMFFCRFFDVQCGLHPRKQRQHYFKARAPSWLTLPLACVCQTMHIHDIYVLSIETVIFIH